MGHAVVGCEGHVVSALDDLVGGEALGVALDYLFRQSLGCGWNWCWAGEEIRGCVGELGVEGFGCFGAVEGAGGGEVSRAVVEMCCGGCPSLWSGLCWSCECGSGESLQASWSS